MNNWLTVKWSRRANGLVRYCHRAARLIWNVSEATKDRPTGRDEGYRRILNVYPEDVVQTKIQRWGNSLGLRIPRAFASEAGVDAGAEVDLSVRGGNLIVRPARRVKYRLDDLVRKITAKNLHQEVDTGKPVGREVW